MTIYLLMSPWHFNQKVGLGPATVYECENYTGRDACEGTGDDETHLDMETKYCLGGCTKVNKTCGNDTESITTACIKGSATDDPQDFCSLLDQSENDLSNCCLGEYSLITEGGNNEVSWGGSLLECIGGSARTNWGNFNKLGVPVSLIENTLKRRIQKHL